MDPWTGRVLAMVGGFLLAKKLPVAVTVALALLFELVLALHIRDNLTLNVLMLVAPLDAVERGVERPLLEDHAPEGLKVKRLQLHVLPAGRGGGDFLTPGSAFPRRVR